MNLRNFLWRNFKIHHFN